LAGCPPEIGDALLLGGAVATATPELTPDTLGGFGRDPPPPFVEPIRRPYNRMPRNATMKW
jgi:hypothetical protein